MQVGASPASLARLFNSIDDGASVEILDVSGNPLVHQAPKAKSPDGGLMSKYLKKKALKSPLASAHAISQSVSQSFSVLLSSASSAMGKRAASGRYLTNGKRIRRPPGGRSSANGGNHANKGKGKAKGNGESNGKGKGIAALSKATRNGARRRQSLHVSARDGDTSDDDADGEYDGRDEYDDEGGMSAHPESVDDDPLVALVSLVSRVGALRELHLHRMGLVSPSSSSSGSSGSSGSSPSTASTRLLRLARKRARGKSSTAGSDGIVDQGECLSPCLIDRSAAAAQHAQ